MFCLLLVLFFQDIEYIRSHYNIEEFIYYNHHNREDHGHLHHLVLNPVFNHLTKHFIKVSIFLNVGDDDNEVFISIYSDLRTLFCVSRYLLVRCTSAMVSTLIC